MLRTWLAQRVYISSVFIRRPSMSKRQARIGGKLGWLVWGVGVEGGIFNAWRYCPLIFNIENRKWLTYSVLVLMVATKRNAVILILGCTFRIGENFANRAPPSDIDLIES